MINKATLIGRIGGDPDFKQLENGRSVVRFSLATTKSYKDAAGEYQNITQWHNVLAWGALAETITRIAQKGQLCFVDGEIQYRKYNDKDGVERNVTDIVADTFRLLEKRDGTTGASQAAQPNPAPMQTDNYTPPTDQKAAHQQRMEAAQVAADHGGDDLPF